MNKKSSLLRTPDGKSFLFPFILVTSLFFLWGFAHSLLDVLNKHFQDILHVSKAQSGLVQAAVYGGYFLMAIPAGLLMKRYGYKKGIIFGLLLYATGAFLFIPAIHIQQFWAFLFALFIIALGLTCLETAANPYSTVLGPKESAEQRLTLSQSFNGLGWIFGPFVGSLIIFGGSDGPDKFSSLAIPYVGIAIVVLMIAVLFYKTRLPEINEAEIEQVEYTEAEETSSSVAYKTLFHYRHFILAIVAQFCYVAAQTGINSFFINYSVEMFKNANAGLIYGSEGIKNVVAFITDSSLMRLIAGPHFASGNPEKIFNTVAGIILAFGGMGLFMIGRFIGSLFMSWFKPNKLLFIYALACVILCGFVISGIGIISMIALCMIYFFMSIMFPTIFALGLKDLGSHTKRASSFLVMAIVGGAIFPALMGYIADVSSMRIGFAVPLVCFCFVFFYGINGYKVRHK
ncbi:MAG: L-fucose:H+ symporter permease [Bacteroidota bacterium]|nr:L-fucose:H+ symporter permease [Bacteroidota bacterium]MDP4204852.1 L-fucose:H+ symporter permease [Bacteroidota bacterium]